MEQLIRRGLRANAYDAFVIGPYEVEAKDFFAIDARRNREFTCASWNPVGYDSAIQILFSHFSGGSRTASAFLCEHLASHGYAVAALDHSEKVLPRPSDAADPDEKKARLEACIEARVPDMQFLLDITRRSGDRVGVVGHSFGGWTALAMPSKEHRVASLVALAPAGASHPRPGIIPATLDFAWEREVPTLIIAGDSDVMIPLDRVGDVFDRVPSAKKLVVLRDVDHLHFVDQAADQHERMRATVFPPELSWMREEMRAFADLRSEAEAHRIIAGLTVAHFDATLRADPKAKEFLASYSDTQH